MIRLRLAAFTLFAMVAACGVQPADEAVAGPTPKVLTEHRFSELGAFAPERGHLALGADCSKHGAASCASGLCLHVAHDRDTGFVCSRQCEGNEACPPKWRCGQTHPSPGGAICVPGGTL